MRAARGDHDDSPVMSSPSITELGGRSHGEEAMVGVMNVCTGELLLNEDRNLLGTRIMPKPVNRNHPIA